MERIQIEILSLTNFRNYNSLNVQFGDGFNVITGLNGAGKTTILDAIYYLSNGKSYFTYLDRDVYKIGTDFFRIEGTFNKGTTPYNTQIVSAVSKKKTITLNEKKLNTLAELVGLMPSFIVAPKDIRILIESSKERRKVTDRTISHSDQNYLVQLLKYTKILKQRDAYLKDINKKGMSDALFLESLDQGLLAPAQYIYVARKKYISAISPLLSQYYKVLSDSAEEVTVTYKTQLHDYQLIDLLKQHLRKDVFMGKTSVGIHKDDLEILINGRPIKKIASQGQLKSAIIALKLAQMEWIKQVTAKEPILLLDDIFDKLDLERVEKLLGIAMQGEGRQVFITDTDEQRVGQILERLGIAYKQIILDNGKLTSERQY